MEIIIDEVIKDEYVLAAGDHVFAFYPTLVDAIQGMKTFSLDYIRTKGIKLRHRLTAFVDREVDCSDLLND